VGFFNGVPSMCDSREVEVLYPTNDGGEGSAKHKGEMTPAARGHGISTQGCAVEVDE
jgi:hypothetical protein